MVSVLRRTLLKAKHNVIINGQGYPLYDCLITKIYRPYSDEKNTDYTSSTILYETGLEVQELPVIIRKVKDIESFYANNLKEDPEESLTDNDTTESQNYDMIRAEFKECLALRDVFTLLSKCTKITPNIALGAMERIYDLEKNPHPLDMDPHNARINVAKGAIIAKLLEVVMKTEDTATILNALKSVSTFVVPYKHQFSEELLIRALDNKLSVEQLCEFVTFLGTHKNHAQYSEMIDQLWVAFIAKENKINIENLVNMFQILPYLKESRKPVLNILEQKLIEQWCHIKTPGMQEILNAFIKDKYMPLQNYEVCGRWFHTNIHKLDEDNFLEIITKFSKLKYTNNEIEKAIQKYIKAKGHKINSQVLVVGVMNYCMQFQLRNPIILNGCCDYFINNGDSVPYSFLKSIIYPYGFLSFDPTRSTEFWNKVESVVDQNFKNMKFEDISFILLSFIYFGRYPLDLVHKFFKLNQQIKSNDILKKNMYLIDTALSLECCDYPGPLLPKDQWSKNSIPQDARIINIIEKLKDDLTSIAGSSDKISTPVFIPHLHADETYLIDVMLHPVGLGNNTTNWKAKVAKNENVALLIHLPEHYCADDVTLIGPQLMRMKHLRLMGIKVVSLRYSQICRYLTSNNNDGLSKYLIESIQNAEPCL